MYGRGNYGQGLQRPILPYQQAHPSAPHLQPRNTVPIIQQGGPPLPSGPSYLHGPPAPPNMPHQAPPLSTSNISQPYLRPPPPPPSFIGAQQNFVSGHQNPQLPPPPPSSMGPRAPPPPPPFVQLPPPPPPPPTSVGFFPAANFESSKQQSAEPHTLVATPQQPLLPPSSPPRAPPPPSSSQTQSGNVPVPEQALVSESSGNITNGDTPISDEDMPLKQNVLVGLPRPPPKPSDEKVVRNIEVLCQFIAKNGPEFEEMARKNESGNPDFIFLVGGDPGSEAGRAHEYFLWMKKKCNAESDLHKDQGQMDLSQRDFDVEPSSGPNALSNVGTAHSPGDYDVDMEDDITQSDKEHGAYTSIEYVEPEAVVVNDASEMPTQDDANELPDLKDNNPALISCRSANLQDGAESKPAIPASQPTNLHSPFRLIQNYASDDSSDDGEQCHESVKAMVVSPSGKSVALSSHDGIENFNKEPDIGLGQSVTTCLDSELAKDQDDLLEIQGELQAAPMNASQRKYEVDDLDDRIEVTNTNTAFHLEYATGSGGVGSDVKHRDGEKEDKKVTSSSAVKVDEFGRRVKEGASDDEFDESYHLRRRGRRDRSRSRSRTPSDRRRRRSPRRSPRRRKERRSRSRSFSPKRRRGRSRSRSRSRSPYRSGRDFHGEKFRRSKDQTPKCFDFLKGRCYRGAACRYMHHEPNGDESIRRHNSKQHYEADKHDNRDLVSQKCDERSIAEIKDDAAGPSVSHKDVDKFSADVKVTGASDEPNSDHRIHEEQLSSVVPSANEQVMNNIQAEGSANEPIVDNISNESSAPNASASDFSNQVSHLPPPPFPQQVTNAHYNCMAPSGTLPPQSVPVESGPLYLPSQHSHYPVPPNPAWNPPLQPRPPHMVGPSMLANPMQIQHGNFPSHSQIGGFSHQTYHLPSSNILAQPFAGSNIARDDRYAQFPTQSIVSSGSFVPGVAPQPVSFQGDSTASQSMPTHGGSLPVPGFSSNLLDRADSSSFFDVEGTRLSTHYNPYASTFDQPLSTRLSSVAFAQGIGLGPPSVDPQASADPSSRQIISSNSSKAGGQTVLKSGGDQYDPLFDSIDPKRAQKQDHAADNADIISKLSNRHNVEENDEFGETAEAEVGAVENGSPSGPNDDADIAEGDIEIDQVKPEGRSKKSKDSRSMKLFKAAVANFVKDMLKPQWRQGNMSKEVFKTIVKKTVDKVSGAMKNHRLPKSQAKIDHYIDSSRRKLTQLVEGYVSKYMS